MKNNKISHFYFTVMSNITRDDGGITLVFQPANNTNISKFDFYPDEEFPSGLSYSNFKEHSTYVVGYTIVNGTITYLYADEVTVLNKLK